MMRLAFLAVLILLVSFRSMASPSVSPRESEQNKITLLRYLWPFLKEEGETGRVYYEGTCANGSLTFPEIRLSHPATRERGLSAVKSIFRNAEDVLVTRNSDGIVSIRIGNVPDRILRTKISKVFFTGLAGYNHDIALGAVDTTPEVREALSKLRVRGSTSAAIRMTFVQPNPELPHLPPVLTDLTMDQALDAIARTFKGVVVFGGCERPPTIGIDFIGGVYFDETTLTRGQN